MVCLEEAGMMGWLVGWLVSGVLGLLVLWAFFCLVRPCSHRGPAPMEDQRIPCLVLPYAFLCCDLSWLVLSCVELLCSVLASAALSCPFLSSPCLCFFVLSNPVLCHVVSCIVLACLSCLAVLTCAVH